MKRIVHPAIALAVLACSSAPAPAPTPSPADSARGLRNLNDPKAEAELTAIAVAAARSLPPSSSTRGLFSGVFVDGRRAREATQAVIRAAGLTEVSSSRGVKVQCRSTNMSTGQSTPIPCPTSVAASQPPVMSFAEVRATADSAYVGLTETTDRSSRASCITLERTASDWRVVTQLTIADARRCGK